MNAEEKLQAIKELIEALGDPEFWSYAVLDDCINKIYDIAHPEVTDVKIP